MTEIALAGHLYAVDRLCNRDSYIAPVTKQAVNSCSLRCLNVTFFITDQEASTAIHIPLAQRFKDHSRLWFAAFTRDRIAGSLTAGMMGTIIEAVDMGAILRQLLVDPLVKIDDRLLVIHAVGHARLIS